MEIDGDVGRYGSMLIFSDLNNNPEEAFKELIHYMGINIEENWAQCLNFENVEEKSDIHQILELEFLVNFKGANGSEKIIQKLSGYHVGHFDNDDLPADIVITTKFRADVYLELESQDEEFDESSADGENSSFHKIAKFRTSISVG